MDSVMTEASQLLRELAKPAIPGESIKSIHRMIARKLGWVQGRVYRAWYGNIVLRADDMDTLRKAAGQAAIGEEHEARIERRELHERLERMELILRALLEDKNGASA